MDYSHAFLPEHQANSLIFVDFVGSHSRLASSEHLDPVVTIFEDLVERYLRGSLHHHNPVIVLVDEIGVDDARSAEHDKNALAGALVNPVPEDGSILTHTATKCYVCLDVVENGIFLNEGSRVFHDEDTLVDVVENSVLQNPTVGIILNPDACLLVLADFNILENLRVVVFTRNHDPIFQAVFYRVQLDFGLIYVRVESFGDYAAPAVRQIVSYNRGVAGDGIDSVDHVFYLVVENARPGSQPNLDPVFLHVVLDPLYDVLLHKAFVLKARDLDVSPLVLIKPVFNDDYDGLLGRIDDDSALLMPVDFAGVDKNICILDKEADGWIDRVPPHEAIFEDALGARVKHDRRNG